MTQGDHHLKVLGFLGGLRTGSAGGAGGAAHGALPDLGDFALEGLVGDSVNRHLGRLPEPHVDDVRLIHFDFGGNHGQIGDLVEQAPHRVLNSRNHVFAHVHGQRGNHAIERRGVDGLFRASTRPTRVALF